MSRIQALASLFIFGSLLTPACGQSSRTTPSQTPLNQRVLVVVNSAAPDSLAVARHYMRLRSIPEKLLCPITPTSPDAIPVEEFNSAVKPAIRRCLEEAGKQKILYLVFSHLTPYGVGSGNRRSLDQMVADIWDEYLPDGPGNPGKPHPYFGEAESEGGFYGAFVPLSEYRDKPGAKTIYSVWRLDGANADLAKGLVDKAITAESGHLTGSGCFDRRFGDVTAQIDTGYGSGDWEIYRAAEFARQAGFRVMEDEQDAEFGAPPAPLRCEDAAFYAGWYSLNHYNDAFSWVPGAIGIHLDSYSALDPRAGPNWVANAILKGITVTSGAVAEPYLQGLPRPDQVFLYLFQGANVGDALLRGTPWLKWMIINIGDPLYRPFPKGIARLSSAAYDSPYLAVAPRYAVGQTSLRVHFHLANHALPGGTPLVFKSDHPELISAPEPLAIAESWNTIIFPIVARPVSAETNVRITVSGAGVTKTNTIVLYPVPAKP